MRRINWIVVFLITVCFLAASTVSYGFDEKQVQALKKTNSCKKCDLPGVKLSNLDLTYVDLSGANLSGADLTNTVMQSANLFEANLKGANVTNANFTKTYFDQVTWTNGKRCAVGSLGQCK